MKRKRLNRDLNWGFQYFPYYQTELELDFFQGFASLIQLTDGEYYYWEQPKAGRFPVCGKGMLWLQLIPRNQKRLITAVYFPEKKTINGKEYPYSVTGWYVDVIEGWEYDTDGMAIYEDKYLDVIFTPQGDVMVDDRDELDEALKEGDITKEQYEAALAEGDGILKELCTDVERTEAWCSEILEVVLCLWKES